MVFIRSLIAFVVNIVLVQTETCLVTREDITSALYKERRACRAKACMNPVWAEEGRKQGGTNMVTKPQAPSVFILCIFIETYAFYTSAVT